MLYQEKDMKSIEDDFRDYKKTNDKRIDDHYDNIWNKLNSMQSDMTGILQSISRMEAKLEK